MSLAQRLAETAAVVERRLGARLTAETCPATPPRLLAAMRHGVLGGGKRFRPFLVLESAALFEVPTQTAVETAVALECVHCYSLAHDDLPAMDDDEVRRGQPTVWKAFDEWTAILAGDALATLAFEILAGTECHPDPLVRSELALGLARAAGHAGMIGGQALDLEADKRGEPARPTVDHVRRLQAMKTGALIAFAAEAGAILGRADAERRRALAAYGRSLGLAFQIADDLLDVEGDAETVGKAVAKDAHRGKATLISLMGIEPARKLLGEAEAEAIAALAPFGADARWLVEAARFVSRRRH
jgi:farnesyl diphosphate synthase